MTRQYLASCVAAFLFAALTPALIVAGLAGSIQLAPIALFVSLGPAILLGLPLFLILRSTRWINATSSTVGGFIVGVIPEAFLSWPWQLGALREMASPIEGRGVGFIFYGARANSGWEVVARDLVNGLEAAWPGRIHFRDGNNRAIPIPAELKGD